jgi:hypothetical protein
VWVQLTLQGFYVCIPKLTRVKKLDDRLKFIESGLQRSTTQENAEFARKCFEIGMCTFEMTSLINDEHIAFELRED